jgi:hypothetical protein
MLVRIKQTMYMGSSEVVGRVVEAKEQFEGYAISKDELVKAGAISACFTDGETYHFFASELEVFDEHSSNLVKDAITTKSLLLKLT